MYAGGESRPNGGGGGGDALRRRRQPGPSSSPGAAAAASSSLSGSGRGEEEGEEHGTGQKQATRKKQGRREAVARAIRGGLPAACWGGFSVVQETSSGGRRTGRMWSRRETGAAADRDAAGDDGSEPGAGAGAAPAAPAAAWCCVCPGGDCSLEANPSANGKEDPSVRSLLEQNDFFSADCNPHADVLPPAADTADAYDSS